MEPKCVPFPEFEKLDSGLMLAIRELSLDAIQKIVEIVSLTLQRLLFSTHA